MYAICLRCNKKILKLQHIKARHVPTEFSMIYSNLLKQEICGTFLEVLYDKLHSLQISYLKLFTLRVFYTRRQQITKCKRYRKLQMLQVAHHYLYV